MNRSLLAGTARTDRLTRYGRSIAGSVANRGLPVGEIEKSKYWSSTAIAVTYDDSDGWHDHVAGPVINGSNTTADEAICTSVPTRLGSDPDRCGFGPRLPLLVISPYTKANSVSNKLTNQASVDNFIENNWLGASGSATVPSTRSRTA